MWISTNFAPTLIAGLTAQLLIFSGLPVSHEVPLQSLNSSLNVTDLENAKNIVRNESSPNQRVGKLIGYSLGLGLGPGLGSGGYGYGGYGYGGYGNVPFPCSTSRLASFGFPYYNPVCYGYSVPSFPYYGGPLG